MLTVWASFNYQSTLASEDGAVYLLWFGIYTFPDLSSPETWPSYRNEEAGFFRPKFDKWQSGLPRPTRIRLPYWLLALIAAILGALPWLRWRFSLRTMLIGMTVVAALLGALVWAVRK
jgi:hypothetical protein